MAFFKGPKGLILVMVILALVIGGVYLFSQKGQPKEEESTPAPTTGTIEGSLSFPSEFIPTDMTICAEDTSTQKQYCTKDHLQDVKYTAHVGYKIEVPAGSYHVFAYLPGGSGGYSVDYRAYYSEFVTCGLSINCTSHKPIVVAVKAGETTSDINPQDWYNF